MFLIMVMTMVKVVYGEKARRLDETDWQLLATAEFVWWVHRAYTWSTIPMFKKRFKDGPTGFL